MEYSIGEFSEITGISIHTLRYYEKEKLIMPNRKGSGRRRCYTDSDVTWIAFIKRLKDTGMPIKRIQEYAAYRAQGDNTLQNRLEMLVKHRILLLDEIAAMQENLSKLNDKIDYYKTAIENKGNSLQNLLQ